MPFEMPWVKRARQQIDSRQGCNGAREYSRKIKLILDEYQRIMQHVGKTGRFDQRRYS